MTSLTTFAVAAGVLLIALAIWRLLRAARAWHRAGGERVVTCPETGRPAAVRIDRTRAALSALVAADPTLQLADCSRWATRGRCDEPCLPEASDDATTVSSIAATWFAGQLCVYCGDVVREDPLAAHHGALLAPDGTTREWADIAPEHLRDALRTGRPVCWNCHVAETFRRRYPGLVTDRTGSRSAS